MTKSIRGILLAALLVAELAAAQDGVRTQTYELQPGWNAIFVEVIPEPSDMDAIFSGIPVEGVWGWFPPSGQIDFVDDPAQGLLDLEGWRGWFPRPRPESILSNVFGIQAHRAYLIELGGDAPVTLEIAGRPVNFDLEWTPDSFNLVGFPVDTSNPPSFGTFLTPSSAHTGQPIYRLSTAGEWQLLSSPFSAPIRSGEAYWVYTSGNSDYQGPLEVDVGAFDGMEFSAALDELRLTIRNRGLSDAQMRVRTVPSSTAIPFLERGFTDSGAQIFTDLAVESSYPTIPGQDLFVHLGIRRADLTAERSEQLLEVTDGIGSRRFVFVGVTQFQPPDIEPLAGLWIGDVTINEVSESQTAGTEPTPVGEAFRFRILIHVNASGQARLLKEVTQMWKDGTTRPDSENPEFQVVDVPGRFVWITDPSLIPSYKGATLRDGVLVGLRVSTVAYDFPEHDLPMTGTFGPSGQLDIVLTIPADAPTNPYKHRFHPDHDNLDAEFLGPQIEAFDITRTFTLQFSSIHPAERPGPGWGSNELGGTFLETIEGMHRNPIHTKGSFLLTRVAATPRLND